jgi:hypothetical protein
MSGAIGGVQTLLTFGAFMEYASDDAGDSTASSTFQTTLTHTTASLPAGDYLIVVMAEVSSAIVSTAAELQARVDSTERAAQTLLVPVANLQGAFFAMWKETLGAGTHTLDVKFRSVAGVNTVSTRNVRIVLFRVS